MLILIPFFYSAHLILVYPFHSNLFSFILTDFFSLLFPAFPLFFCFISCSVLSIQIDFVSYHFILCHRVFFYYSYFVSFHFLFFSSIFHFIRFIPLIYSNLFYPILFKLIISFHYRKVLYYRIFCSFYFLFSFKPFLSIPTQYSDSFCNIRKFSFPYDQLFLPLSMLYNLFVYF